MKRKEDIDLGVVIQYTLTQERYVNGFDQLTCQFDIHTTRYQPNQIYHHPKFAASQPGESVN
ncbi:hypothetical protein E2C01_016065 [Portunus trituberculatus]|uniref:Uncharacterized protein n=1 Tax=Portunus trituberculatus TaxID=210409 RepID=A0A5B7DN36_PORTR|nr:hypothetical protein [Portunus trituberculatus]